MIRSALRALAVVLALSALAFATTGVSLAATTINIPLTTLKVGTSTFGPANIPTGTTDALFSISRTAGSRSLNNAAATTTVDLDIQESFDGGTTYYSMCSTTVQGGTVFDDNGSAATTSYIECPLPDEGSTTRVAKAVITVTGAQVSVSGSLTLS